MERLTSNKNTSDMSIYELAYNNCYADANRNARYRNYELDIDSRELVKDLVEDMCDEDLSDMSNEEFDEYMSEMLSVEMDSQIGLLALFYRNLWAMADLRERLKYYEDLEEQDRLLKLPSEAYFIKNNQIYKGWVDECTISICRKPLLSIRYNDNTLDDFKGYVGNNVFFSKSEAEAKLKELRGREDE